ncbi:MAG: type IV pilus secretin PilQ, partial [Myxococcales bacterium]|nr:type IV pilus secretin PilQ [Myxococcales bacterium]
AVFTGAAQTGGVRVSSRPVTQRKRYKGRRINFDVKDGDIHNILRLLAKEGNVSIVTSDAVQGTVTLHLKLVPWDQALDIVLKTKGLGMVWEGDIIRVDTLDNLNVERDAELKRQADLVKLEALESRLITVNHADAGQLLPRVRGVLSERGKIEFDARTNTVVVTDISAHLDAAEDIIRRLDTQTPQVLIEARIVEVNEVNTQQLGIQWGGDAIFSAATGNPTGLRFPSTVGISGANDDAQAPIEGTASNPNFVVNLPAATGLGSGGALGLTFGSIDSTFNLNVRLSALESHGTVKIVSSPRITTLDNKEATISQGVSIPISQVSAAGVQTVFFDAVLRLTVTPHVTQDGNIYLKMRAENNTPDFQNVGAGGDPTILKKEASTELLLRDGDTTVIGGIYTSNAGYTRAEVPFLARIPILGALFRNHQESDRRTELLIFVTPRIVNRAAASVRTNP